MKHPQDILHKPLITEKSTIMRESQKLYCFKVCMTANKIEIANAVEKLFAQNNVKVADVRTARVRGKVKRMGRHIGRRPHWKKAWVKLTADSQDVELFEG